MTRPPNAPRKPKHPPGAREPCARSRTIASSEPKPRLKRTGAFLLPANQEEHERDERSRCSHCRRHRRCRRRIHRHHGQARFPRRQAQGAGQRPLGRQDHRFPRRADRDRGTDRALLRRRRHRAVLGRRRHFEEVRADRGEVRRGRDRQFLGLPDGSGRAAGDPRDQRPPHPGSQGHHRQPELLGDHGAGAAVADPHAKTASSA